MKKDTARIMAKGLYMSNNTRVTGLNNNDLIIGPSGAGKTTGYVKPNLFLGEGSVIVADTKGALLHEVGPEMARRGYRVLHLDFSDLDRSSLGYDPLDYIRRGEDGQYNQQDVMTIARALCSVKLRHDPFWENSAAMMLASIIGTVLEYYPRDWQTIGLVSELFEEMCSDYDGGYFHQIVFELGQKNPDSFAWRKFCMSNSGKRAERTYCSILSVLAEKLDVLTFDGIEKLFQREERVDFARLGREKTALFLTVSDTDRSMDRLVNLFYTQAFQGLCRSADRDYSDHRLPVPVRFILDDFATNTVIPDFDNVISVIRSRNICASIIIQSLSQLEGLYGHAKAMTIINNCDNCLYLGGQDVETASYFSLKMNRTVDTILNLPLDTAILFTRGQRPRKVEKMGPVDWMEQIGLKDWQEDDHDLQMTV